MVNTEALRAARSAANLRQADLAERVGVTPSAIAHVERGRLTPSANTLAAIAEALGVDVDELLTEQVAS